MKAVPATNTENWQLDLLFDLAILGWIVHLGVVSLTAAMLLGLYGEAAWPPVWWAVMAILSAALALTAWLYVRGRPWPHGTARRFGWAHSILTACVGIAWGVGALAVSSASFQVLLVYSLALGGTALGAVSSQHTFLRSCFLSLWTSVPLLAAAHLLHDSSIYGAINAGMIVLYTAILSVLTLRMRRFMHANVALTASLDAKIAELTSMAGQLDAARREAVEANLAKSRFLAQASHDLRQPIHAIGLFTASLYELRMNAEQKQLVDSIDRSLQSVTKLFRSLLDISSLDIGRVQVRPEKVNLGQLLTGVARQNAGAARDAGREIRTVEADVWVDTDPVLVANILQNLVANALKYADRGPVLIGCRRRDGRVAIWVCDRGPGIAPEHVERIFEDFYRIDGPYERATEGLGLGLAIVRRLAALLGIEAVISSRPGRGTIASVGGFVPVAAPATPRVRRTRASHPLAGRRIALIEDNRDVLEATAGLLGRWGCEVIPLSGAPDSAIGCDAIICDDDLADRGDGLATIARMRALEGWEVPAAVVSGRSEPAVADALDAAGIPYLAKPIHAAELRALLTDFALRQAGARLH